MVVESEENDKTVGDTTAVAPPADRSFLDRFNLLQKSGALDDLANLRRENRELDMLLNDAAELFALGNVEEMIGFVISRLLERFIPMHLVFIVVSSEGEELKQYCYRNLEKDEAIFPIRYYGLLRSSFAAVPHMVAFADLERRLGAEAFGEDIRIYSPELFIPMSGIGGPFGMVLLGRKMLGNDYTDAEKMYIDRSTRFLSIGIQNNLHHESSITDFKTGLYNQRHFRQRLDEEIARISRHRERAGIIMIDIDRFKRFNDTWGHLAGDEILSAKKAVRSEDIASRFGGEEFCILLIECDEHWLVEIAERIRLSIASLAVPWKSEILSVTVSIGCCLIDPARGRNAGDFIDKADKALYASKAAGRNRTTLYRTGFLDRAKALRGLMPASPD
jgi:diguanylate cyclase (GGDEF)-like protein